ncbi:hypothetical protein [Fodinibius salsisoli]|uniref:Uncharacterized protein n=1 Tax=Fodinibius salsisoli TaxID=2820877 RepID=A0ABT3PSG7_9BACT|nr:hypothetical protein [Fodinibius salsisoli]MCW9708808.1 hypothetical protein [Fodinibius salsisoli]
MEYSIGPVEKKYRKCKRYFEFYKSSDDKIEALETLSNVQSKFEQRRDDLEEIINFLVDDLTFFVESFIEKHSKNEVTDSSRENLLERKRRQFIKRFQQDILQANSIHRLESIKEYTQKDLYEHLLEYTDEVAKNVFQSSIKNVIEKGRLYLNAKYHLMTIDYIVKKIIDKNYPDQVIPNSLWGQLYQKEKLNRSSNYLTKTQKNKQKTINRHYLSKIIKEAEKLLKEDHLRCITEGGNATRFFYKTVHSKLSEVEVDGETIGVPSDETVRNRLNDYLKEIFETS